MSQTSFQKDIFKSQLLKNGDDVVDNTIQEPTKKRILKNWSFFEDNGRCVGVIGRSQRERFKTCHVIALFPWTRNFTPNHLLTSKWPTLGSHQNSPFDPRIVSVLLWWYPRVGWVYYQAAHPLFSATAPMPVKHHKRTELRAFLLV